MIYQLKRCVERATNDIAAKREGAPFPVLDVALQALNDPALQELRETLDQPKFSSLGGEQILINELKRTARDLLRTTRAQGRRVYQAVGSVRGQVYWKRSEHMTRAELAWLAPRIRKQGQTMIREADVMDVQLRLIDERGGDLFAGEVEEEAHLEVNERYEEED